MARAWELSPGRHPWVRADLEPHQIASADWALRHPALCYEFGDKKGEPFMTDLAVLATLGRPSLVVVLWQPHIITYIELAHDTERTFVQGLIKEESPPQGNWCDIKTFDVRPFGVQFRTLYEGLDPRPVVLTLADVLRTPLGWTPPKDQYVNLVPPEQPLNRILIEFPDETEGRPLPLDTSITTLSALSAQEYLDTIRRRPTL